MGRGKLKSRKQRRSQAESATRSEHLDAPDTPAARGPIGRRYMGSLLGLRVSALIEMAIFFAGALLLDHFLLGGTRFAAVQPHPFWIIVLLMSVQYGTNEGVFAAIASSAALLVGHLPPHTIDQDFYAYLFGISLNPMLWCVTAVVIGELRMRYARRESDLSRSLADAEHREETIALAYQELMAAHEQLELSVASELNTVLTLHRASKDLQNLSAEDIMNGAGNMVATVMNARKFSIFRLSEGRLTLSYSRGWTGADDFRDAYTADDWIFETTVGSQRVLCMTEPADEQILGADGLLAGPIVAHDTGEVLGMLKVEEMAFADLNFTAVENFKILCELLGNAIANARRFEFVASESIVSGSSMLYSDAYFARQTAFLAGLARRLNFPVSLMRITVLNPDQLDGSEKARIPALVRDCTLHVLRSTDLAFEFRSSQWQYVIVLPNTPMSNIRIVSEKFRLALEKGLSDTHARLEIDTEPLVDASELSVPRAGEPEPASGIEDYTRETQFLIALSRRTGFPMCGLKLSVVLNVELPDAVRRELSSALMTVVRRALSDADLVFDLEPMGQVVAVLLPGVALPDARRKADQIKAALTEKLRPLGKSVHAEITVRELVAGQRAAPPRRTADRVTELDATPCSPSRQKEHQTQETASGDRESHGHDIAMERARPR